MAPSSLTTVHAPLLERVKLQLGLQETSEARIRMAMTTCTTGLAFRMRGMMGSSVGMAGSVFEGCKGLSMAHHRTGVAVWNFTRRQGGFGRQGLLITLQGRNRECKSTRSPGR